MWLNHLITGHVLWVLQEFQIFLYMPFYPFIVGLCCTNNGAQCPNGVQPTTCSNSMLMITECNLSYLQPSMLWHSCVGKLSLALWQSRSRHFIPSNLFCHLSNYRVVSVCILKEECIYFFLWACGVSEWIRIIVPVDSASVIITRVELSKHTPLRHVGQFWQHT